MYKKIKIVAFIALVLSGVHFYFNQEDQPVVQNSKTDTQQVVQKPDESPKTGVLGVFSGLAFSELYSNLALPNTSQIIEPIEITGNQLVDERIYNIAEERGYVLQAVPSTKITELNGIDLQEYAARDFRDLIEAAKQAGHNISVRSGYRDVDEQRGLLLQRLSGDYSDNNINQVLKTTAPPGYSRHHTGYTVDLKDSEHNVFEYTGGYDWISKDNYKNAKKFGFIPSYPKGVKKQGPNPEPWEFIWVGKDTVKQ